MNTNFDKYVRFVVFYSILCALPCVKISDGFNSITKDWVHPAHEKIAKINTNCVLSNGIA